MKQELNTTNNSLNQDLNDPKTAYVMEELANLSKKAALAFQNKLHNDFDLEKYKAFLNIMYHYTSLSAEMIKYVGDLAKDQELKDYFHHMYKEEKNHYLLAAEDLSQLGSKVSKEKPQTVLDFHNMWFSLDKEVYGYLGAICVFENIAQHIQTEGKELYEKLGLTKGQRRWVAVHLEADLEHGQEINEVCAKYVGRNPEAVLKGGRAMCDSWINVFTSF